MTPIAVHAFNPGPMTGSGNATWLIPGRVPTLIDAGVGDPRHLNALEATLAGGRLAQVIVTHAHVDHASGAEAIAERMPHVRFLKMSWPGRDAEWDVRWEPLADGGVLSAGDTTLEVIHTPGHSPDHVCLWNSADRVLFCGDLAWQGSTVVISPGAGGDVAEYLASLERVRRLGPRVMLPAHGPIIDDPESLLEEYVVHRRLREEQVLDAMRVGIGRIDDIVARIYPTLSAALVPLACESVLAQLIKLERDGRAGRVADAWHIISP